MTTDRSAYDFLFQLLTDYEDATVSYNMPLQDESSQSLTYVKIGAYKAAIERVLDYLVEDTAATFFEFCFLISTHMSLVRYAESNEELIELDKSVEDIIDFKEKYAELFQQCINKSST